MMKNMVTRARKLPKSGFVSDRQLTVLMLESQLTTSTV